QRLRNLCTMIVLTHGHMHGAEGRWLVGYLSYGGSYATVAKRLGLGKSMVVCFEPHSRYMVEMGKWGPTALRTRIAAWFERMQMRHASAAIVPTKAGMDLARSWNVTGRLLEQGITIDVAAARHDATARIRIRNAHRWGDRNVLAYVGKFGGIYHTAEQYIRFMEGMCAEDEGLHFLIITQQEWLDRLGPMVVRSGLSDRVTMMPPVPNAELHQVLSAADVGVVAIPPTPSQAFRTPVKSAHYWAAGLPLLIPHGVSDDAVICSEHNVGIVVPDLPMTDATVTIEQLRMLLNDDRDSLRARCMEVAYRYRDTSLMVDKLRDLLEWGS
ncbi:MAG TPA: hypothetical protein PK760_07985, partial [Flavobacteriales bacterium]|nr:hypothetical protein [Flavobacteriales bacterium]